MDNANKHKSVLFQTKTKVGNPNLVTDISFPPDGVLPAISRLMSLSAQVTLPSRIT
jgi:hypothetical protein